MKRKLGKFTFSNYGSMGKKEKIFIKGNILCWFQIFPFNIKFVRFRFAEKRFSGFASCLFEFVDLWFPL